MHTNRERQRKKETETDRKGKREEGKFTKERRKGGESE